MISSNNFRSILAIAALMVVLPVAAQAHPGHAVYDLAHGVSHPFSGWDHLLAMFAVGLWTVQLDQRSRWLLPVSFVGSMCLGAGIGMLGLTVGGLELIIALSVLTLGCLIAGSARMSLRWALPLVGLFGCAHGLAHGVEMPVSSAGWVYGLGMICATAVLHGAGIVCGLGFVRLQQNVLARVTGGVIAGVGAVLLLG